MGIDSSTNLDSDDDCTAPSMSFPSTIKTENQERLLEQIANTEFPPQVESLLETYDELVGVRDPFIWRWIYTSIQPIRLSCVPADKQDTVTVPKMIAMIYVTVVDDIADQLGDAQLLEAVTRIHSRHTDVSDLDTFVRDSEAAAHLEFARRTWDMFETELRDAPRADEYWSLLEFDMERMHRSMKYSMLLTDHLEMANFTEGLGHHSHSCPHYMAADIDLMYSPEFDCVDLGPLRRLLWEGQQLHRLVNWAVTWERELDEDDVTSGVFALALTDGVVDTDDLARVQSGDADPETIRATIQDNNLEQRLIDRCEERYTDMLKKAREAEVQSVDLTDYVTGVRQICRNHRIAQGRI